MTQIKTESAIITQEVTLPHSFPATTPRAAKALTSNSMGEPCLVLNFT